MKVLIIIIMSLNFVYSATYYMRFDGTAATKEDAVGPASSQSACMDVTVFNGEIFASGDTILMSSQGGRYNAILTVPSSGIYIKNVSGENPIISGSDNEATPSYDRTECIVISSKDSVTIDSIECRYAGGVLAADGECILISGTSSGIVIKNCTIHNNKNESIKLYNTSIVSTLNNILHDNGDSDISLHDTATMFCDGDSMYNSPRCIENIDNTSITVRNCYLRDFDGTSAIEIIGSGTPYLKAIDNTIDGTTNSGVVNGINMSRGLLDTVSGNNILNVRTAVFVGVSTTQDTAIIINNTITNTTVYGVDCNRGVNFIFGNTFKNADAYAVINRASSILHFYRNRITENASAAYGNGVNATGEFYCAANIHDKDASFGYFITGTVNAASTIANCYFNASAFSAIDAGSKIINIRNCVARGSVNNNYRNIANASVINCVSSKADLPVDSGNVNSVNDSIWLTYFESLTITDNDYALIIKDGPADSGGVDPTINFGTYYNNVALSAPYYDIGATGIDRTVLSTVNLVKGKYFRFCKSFPLWSRRLLRK